MSVVVLDEAGMVGTRDLAELAAMPARPAPSWCWWETTPSFPRSPPGEPSGRSHRRLGAIELSENRRQQHQWERDALLAIREGRPREAVEAYLAHGRIHVGEDAEAAKRALVADWWQATRAGDDAIMICATRAEAEDLRAGRGRYERLPGRSAAAPWRSPAARSAAGDRVMALRNDRLLSVENGLRGTVVGVDRGRGVELQTTSGRRVMLPGWYLAAGNLTYADAITAHKAQGLTVDRAFVLGTRGLSREWGYAALSRARGDTRLYLEIERARGRDLDELGGPHEQGGADALGRLAGDLSREQAKELAREREPPGLSCGLER